MPKKIETQLDIITQRAVNVATALFAVDTRKWERQIEDDERIQEYIDGQIEKLKEEGIIFDDLSKKEKEKLREKLIKGVPKLTFQESKKTLRLYEQVLFIYYLVGLDSALDDINALKTLDRKDGAKNVPTIEREITFTVWQGIDWSNIGFPEALQRFKDKQIISPLIFKEAEAAIKATAFSIQRIDELNAIEIMNAAIARAIEDEIIFRDWIDIFLPRIYAAAGYKKTLEFDVWHLETIFRTNQASVYNAGRWDGFQADNYVLALQYQAVLDERTREEHEALDGFTAFKTDAVWSEIYPPNGYNCRCIVAPLSKFRMDKQGISLTGGKPDLKNVDPDFRYSPGLFNYRDLLAGVVKKAERAI